ncbi:DUF7305 domain-containing protein [Coraliomargarita parva]|uniref:DUF7305 domain-containing protein n=1 Tax=Coraliomargarita parva TaxID=3014050 RepID=UPI0022B34D9F|nr:hypothetical protein [Coraliomargarita parva]
MPTKTAHIHARHSNSGSALITAVIFSFIIGMLAVTFLKLATHEYRAAVRSTLYSSSFNLAESGVELGVEALADNEPDSSTWSKSVSNYLVDRGFVGDVRLVIFDALTLDPTIYAEGTISGHDAGAVTKQVKAKLNAGFYPYEKGFSARNGIVLTGNNVMLDSYNSNYGAYGESTNLDAPDGYGVAGLNKNDIVTVASDTVNAVDEGGVDQGNADVYGYVAVSPDSVVSIGPNGMVTSYDSETHDESRVSSDFYADFPPMYEPGGSYDDSSYTSINSSDLIVGTVDNEETEAVETTQYSISEISLSGGGDTLVIKNNVTIIMTGDISVTGQGEIILGGYFMDTTVNGETVEGGGSYVGQDPVEGASYVSGQLTIYTSEDITIGGGGVTNSSGIPSDFVVYGTAEETVASDGTISASQDISITGNGVLAATVYAPAADVDMSGGGNSGNVFGAVVGFTAKISGNSSFHFDEALMGTVVTNGTYTIKTWLEMTGTTASTKPLDLDPYFSEAAL